MTIPSIDLITHERLTAADLDQMRSLFEDEYLDAFGEWDPDLPFGYAPHDVHILARQGTKIVGHVGWARRSIRVGDTEVDIAGVGGVLVSGRARGAGLAGRMMSRAAESMSAAGSIDFGYLGCREDVVPFYVACGWTRIWAVERSVSRLGELTCDEPGQPLLIAGIEKDTAQWPNGDIDLRGRPW